MTELDALLETAGKRGFMWHMFRIDPHRPEVLAGVFQRSGCADVFVFSSGEHAHAYRVPTGRHADVFARGPASHKSIKTTYVYGQLFEGSHARARSIIDQRLSGSAYPVCTTEINQSSMCRSETFDLAGVTMDLPRRMAFR